MAARNYSERTQVEYSFDVEELVSFLEKTGIEKAGELGVPILENYMAELDGWRVAGSTRSRKVVSIQSFLTFLYQNDYINETFPSF